MSIVRVQLGGQTVSVQVQSSGFARANEAVSEAAASAASAAASAAAASATLAAAALKANNLSDLASASTALTNLGGTTVGKSVFTAANAAAARTATGTVIGTDVQAYDPDLAAIAALTSAADKMPYATGAGTWAMADLTSFARSLLATANNSAFLAALGQIASTAINFLQSGTGAVQRTGQAKLRDCISIKDFGAVGDGVTNDAPAINAALTASLTALAGRDVYIPGSGAVYLCGSTIVVPSGSRMVGDGPRSSSRLKKGFNGTLLTLDDGSALDGVSLDGNGATYTGKGIEHIGGNQTVRDTRILDTADTAVYFTVTSGANCHYENVTAYRYNAAPGSGLYAFAIEDSASAPGGTPRHFVNIKTGGAPSFYFGAANNVMISASALYDLGWPVYSAGVREYSRNVEIVGCRIGSTAQLDIYGSGAIVGCDIGSKVSLKPTSVFCLGPNLYNNGWEDVSNAGDNLIYSINDIDYTPVCSAGGVPITLGNGTLVGRYSREGRTLRVMIRLLPGSTTSFGAGQLDFTLPQATSFAFNQVGIDGRFEATSGTLYRINGRIAAGGSVVLLERDTTGAVTSTSPGTMAVTGAITMTVVYDV